MFWRVNTKDEARRNFVLHNGKGWAKLKDALPLPYQQNNFWKTPQKYVSQLVVSKAQNDQIVGVMVEETLRTQRSLLRRAIHDVGLFFMKLKNPLQGDN